MGWMDSRKEGREKTWVVADVSELWLSTSTHVAVWPAAACRKSSTRHTFQDSKCDWNLYVDIAGRELQLAQASKSVWTVECRAESISIRMAK